MGINPSLWGFSPSPSFLRTFVKSLFLQLKIFILPFLVPPVFGFSPLSSFKRLLTLINKSEIRMLMQIFKLIEKINVAYIRLEQSLMTHNEAGNSNELRAKSIT